MGSIVRPHPKEADWSGRDKRAKLVEIQRRRDVSVKEEAGAGDTLFGVKTVATSERQAVKGRKVLSAVNLEGPWWIWGSQLSHGTVGEGCI